MKIVLAGALGHIGSHLIRTLPLEFPGIEITMIDNLITQRFSGLFNLPTEGNYHFIEGDLLDLDLSAIIAGADAVLQFAALTDATASFERREEMEHNNFNTIRLMAEACASADAPLLHPSSTSVYGTQNEVVDEDCAIDELAPQSPYAETKLREEKMLLEMGQSKGLKFITCRFGTIFGTSAGMRFHTVVNKFCWQAVMGQKLTVWTTAYDQKRPYLDLNDCAQAVFHIIRNNLFDNRIYNVLTTNTTVREVVEIIRRFIPDLEVGFVDSEIMNQLSYEVSSERFQKTGLSPKGDLVKGIEKTINLLANANGRPIN